MFKKTEQTRHYLQYVGQYGHIIRNTDIYSIGHGDHIIVKRELYLSFFNHYGVRQSALCSKVLVVTGIDNICCLGVCGLLSTTMCITISCFSASSPSLLCFQFCAIAFNQFSKRKQLLLIPAHGLCEMPSSRPVDNVHKINENIHSLN